MPLTPEQKAERNLYSFCIGGEPKAQKRHKHRIIHKQGSKPFATTYDPSAKAKRGFALLASQHAPGEPLDVPLYVSIIFHMPYAKTHIGTGRNAGRPKPSAPKQHIKKPDIDNLAKFVFDALSGMFWKDDSVIVATYLFKVYSTDPRTEIYVCRAAEDNINGGA